MGTGGAGSGTNGEDRRLKSTAPAVVLRHGFVYPRLGGSAAARPTSGAQLPSVWSASGTSWAPWTGSRVLRRALPGSRREQLGSQLVVLIGVRRHCSA